MPMEAPIRPRKLYEEIVARIADMIHAGEYSLGDELPSERALMLRYGVGRPAVREAMLTLHRMGLITLRSGVRARVTQPSPQHLIGQLSGAARLFLSEETGIKQFQDARKFLELGLARFAALHATAADIKRLADALAANRRSIGDAAAFARTDVDFHFVLPLITRNAIFIAIHEATLEWLTSQRTTGLKNRGEDKIAYAAHEAIYAAIAAHDPDRAERAMSDHLERVSQAYWRMREPLQEKAAGLALPGR
jgi:GntR family transcriptional repressor for pyruvate dehydrogenase complex